MAFTAVGDATAGGSSASASVTHGLTINDGDLVVAYLNVNGPQTIAADSDTGGAWAEKLSEEPVGETARQAVFSKIANSSEPSSYSFTLGASDLWRVVVKVFRPGSGTPTVDAAANSAVLGFSDNQLLCNAINGEVISDGAVSIIFGGKDNRNSSAPTSFTTADNSYTGVAGATTNQVGAGAHRIYTTGLTFSGSVSISGATAQTDNVYSIHISFVESAGGTTFTETHTFSATGTSALSTTVIFAKALSYSATGTLAFAQQSVIGVVASMTATGTAALSKIMTAVRGLDFSATGTVTLGRKITKFIAINATGSAATIVGLITEKAVSFTATATAAFSKTFIAASTRVRAAFIGMRKMFPWSPR